MKKTKKSFNPYFVFITELKNSSTFLKLLLLLRFFKHELKSERL